MLMYFDDHQHLQTLRSGLSLAVFPIRAAVDLPMHVIDLVGTSVLSHHHLLKDNKQLRAEVFQLKAELQRFIALQNENQALRALLSASSQLATKVLTARIVAVDQSPLNYEVIINRGSGSGVFVGQAVLDQDGILGQVIEADVLTSRVLLLTDPRSAIPVVDSRNNVRCLLQGTGVSDRLVSQFVPQTADLKKGDLLLSSGLGGVYPSGYPVAKISRVKHTPGHRFADVLAKPTAQLDRSLQVLLIWPTPSH